MKQEFQLFVVLQCVIYQVNYSHCGNFKRRINFTLKIKPLSICNLEKGSKFIRVQYLRKIIFELPYFCLLQPHLSLFLPQEYNLQVQLAQKRPLKIDQSLIIQYPIIPNLPFMKVLAVCIFLIAVLARQVLAENVTASVLSKKTITTNPKKSQTSAVLQKASQKQSPQSLTQQASASLTTQKPATIATATTATLSFPSPQLMLAPTLPTPPVLPHPNSPVPTSTSPLPLPIPNIIQSINVLNNYNQAVTVTVRYVSGLTQTYTVLPSNSMLIQNPVTVGTYTYLELINQFTFMVGTAVLGSGNNGNAVGIENRAYTITATGSLVRTA